MSKFKTVFAVLLAVLAFESVADSEYASQTLYWQVGPISTLPSGDTDGDPFHQPVYATLYATVNSSGEVSTRQISTTDTPSVWRDTWKNTDLAGTSFYVELMNSYGYAYARSESVAYAMLFDQYFDATPNGSGTPVTHTASFVFTNYSDIPEPTGGVLMLVGLAALALRRRHG